MTGWQTVRFGTMAGRTRSPVASATLACVGQGPILRSSDGAGR